MTTFDERERAFEAKFASDAEHAFRILARRDRLLGEWAGTVLGKSGEALEAYAASVVRADLKGPGDEDVALKVEADLADRPEAAQVRERMKALLDTLRTDDDATPD